MAGDGQVEIGVVARAHGVRGELRVRLHNPDSTALDVVMSLFIADRSYEIASARLVKGGALVRLAEVDDRNEAETLVGKAIFVERGELELEEDDLLISDFLNCSLVLEDGTPWGKVVEVVAGTQDRLVVHHGNVERYLPLVDAFIVDVDLDARSITVSPPEELPEWERE